MFSEYAVTRLFSFRYSSITRREAISHQNFSNKVSFHLFQWTRLSVYFSICIKSWIYLSTNGFAALNDAILSFNLGPFYLCPPTKDCIHEKGEQSFRGILWESHILASSGPLVSVLGYREEKRLAVRVERTWNVEKGKRKQNISCS